MIFAGCKYTYKKKKRRMYNFNPLSRMFAEQDVLRMGLSVLACIGLI